MRYLFLYLFLSSSSLFGGTRLKKIQALMNKNEPTVLVDIASRSGHDSIFPLQDPLASLTFARNLLLYELYSRPIENSMDRTYKSHILESFEYDPMTQHMTFVMKNGVFFSDGNPITVEDLALSFLRAVRLNTDISPFGRIIGIKEWIKQNYPLKNLPKGVKIDKKRRSLVISFSSPILDPYYWFTFPMFSVIPKHCDLKRGYEASILF